MPVDFLCFNMRMKMMPKLNEPQNELLSSLASVLDDADFQENVQASKDDAELTAEEHFLRDFQTALEKSK